MKGLGLFSPLWKLPTSRVTSRAITGLGYLTQAQQYPSRTGLFGALGANAAPMAQRYFSALACAPAVTKRVRTKAAIEVKAALEPLPVVDALVSKALAESKSLPLEKTAVVYVHHPLRTSLNLVDSLIELGALPNRIFVLGKMYSECASVVDSMKKLGVFYQPCSPQIGLGKFYNSFTRDINWLWSNVLARTAEDKGIENVLIMDHGGHALAYTPAAILDRFKVVGIEKTTGGLINPEVHGLPFPLIEVASCAGKRVLESPLIANALVAKLLPLIPSLGKGQTCGVVGYGAIGKALTDKLLSMGHKVIVYDNDPAKLKTIRNAEATDTLGVLIAFADYVFGCTGRDITQTMDYFRLCTRNRTLISCSSEDREFLTLLQAVQKKQNGKVATRPLSDIEYQTAMGATIRIVRGGFPVNFDHSGESVPANDIQLTRALVLGGVLQATDFFAQPSTTEIAGNYKLDPRWQSFIAREWLKCQPHNLFPTETTSRFDDLNWIAENSGGALAAAVRADANQQMPPVQNAAAPKPPAP